MVSNSARNILPTSTRAESHVLAGATCRAYSDGNSLWTAINNDPPYRTRMRIMQVVGNQLLRERRLTLFLSSIYSERTIYPLQITSDLLCKILRKYDVHPDFFRVVLSFGEEPHLAEASSGNLAIHPSGADRTGMWTRSKENQSKKLSCHPDISYQINYVEENLRKGQDPWSFRHTGVYHRHSPDLDLFILLHPNQYSVIEARLFQRLSIAPETTSYQYCRTGISMIRNHIAYICWSCHHSLIIGGGTFAIWATNSPTRYEDNVCQRVTTQGTNSSRTTRQ